MYLKIEFDKNRIKDIEYLASLNFSITLTISPDTARFWLSEMNLDNRRLDKGKAKSYSKRIKSKEWMLNGEPIIVSNTGRLLNGQHRLQGVVLSGQSVLFDVRFGISSEAFDTIDNGKPRSTADVFHISNIPNANNCAATVRKVLGLNANYTQEGVSVESKPSNRECLDWYNSNKDNGIDEFVKEGVLYYNTSGRILTASEFAAYSWCMSNVDSDKSYDFIKKLATGANVGMDSPVYKLREILLKEKMNNRSSMTQSLKRALIIKSWNFYLKGKTVKRLSFDKQREKFPMIDNPSSE